MPNGFHGSDSEWERIEKPLRILDSILRTFGEGHNLEMVLNERNWPGRAFRWGTTPNKLIQVFLENERELTYTLWISASDHRSRAQYWRHETLAKAMSIDDLKERLPELLVAAYQKISIWDQQYPNAG